MVVCLERDDWSWVLLLQGMEYDFSNPVLFCFSIFLVRELSTQSCMACHMEYTGVRRLQPTAARPALDSANNHPQYAGVALGRTSYAQAVLHSEEKHVRLRARPNRGPPLVPCSRGPCSP